MTTTFLGRKDYEAAIAATRDERMKWWREARFGMFIHYGLYALYGRGEWVMLLENIPAAEYIDGEGYLTTSRSGAMLIVRGTGTVVASLWRCGKEAQESAATKRERNGREEAWRGAAATQ